MIKDLIWILGIFDPNILNIWLRHINASVYNKKLPSSSIRFMTLKNTV